MSCSIVATAAGFNPWKSKNELLDEMIKANHGEDIRKEQTAIMSRGDLLEPVILKQAQKDLDLDDVETNVPLPLSHPDIPLSGSADGFCWSTDLFIREDQEKGIFVMTPTKEITLHGIGAMECKITSAYPEEEPPLWRGPMQLQAIMDIQKIKYGILAICYQSVHWRYFIYPRDEAMVDMIHATVLDMDRRIREEDFFALETADDAAIVHAESNENHIDLEEDALDHIDLFNQANKSIKHWQEVKERSQLSLMDILGRNTKGSIAVNNGLNTTTYIVNWGTRNIKAKPATWKPAVEANVVRNKSINIKQFIDEGVDPSKSTQAGN